MQNQKNRSYYEDLYDKHTVEDCRSWIRICTEKGPSKGAEKLSKKEQQRLANVVIELPLYFRKGDRYLRRKETIDEWMDKDKERDDFIASHPAPTAYCPKCNQKMKLMVDELDEDINNNLRMMFMYRCEPCSEKKAFYNDGVPYVFKNDFCSKCHKEWEKKYTKSKTKVVTKYSCPSCGNKDEFVLDLNDKPEEETADPDFEKDKAIFCISEREGEEYRRFKTVDLPEMKKLSEEMADKEKHKEIYEQAKNTKKLTIAELSELLAEKLSSEDFKGLVITNTEVTRDLIITFTVQDTKHGRDECHSRSDLKKSLTKILDNTNWKVMSDGVSYKLGLLSGRLRGIDDKEVIYEELKEEKVQEND
jgi:hypothetical protein